MQSPSNLPSLLARGASRDLPLSAGISGSTMMHAAGRSKPHLAVMPRRVVAKVMSMPVEAEDAKMTGTTRSLSRRLLALNVRQDA